MSLNPVTINDYFDYSWSGMSLRSDSTDIYQTQFKSCQRPALSFKDECLHAAKWIYEHSKEPIRVLLSGGVDSEVVARSFLDSGIPFEARIFRFKGQGLFDIHYAINFCKARDIKYKIIDFDQDHFLENELEDYVTKYKIHEPFIAFDLKRWQMIDGLPIFGNGDVYLEVINNEIYSVESGSYAIPWVWQKEHSMDGHYRFFKLSAELQLSFLNEPRLEIWKNLIPQMQFENSRWWKQWIYKDIWSDLLIRNKLTGYELFGEKYMYYQKALKNRFGYEKDKHFIELNFLSSQLRPTFEPETKFPDSDPIDLA